MDATTPSRALQDDPAVKPTHSAALPLGADELRRMNAYWRAANYLSVVQIYVYDMPGRSASCRPMSAADSGPNSASRPRSWRRLSRRARWAVLSTSR